MNGHDKLLVQELRELSLEVFPIMPHTQNKHMHQAAGSFLYFLLSPHVHRFNSSPNSFCSTCPSYRSSARSFTMILSPTRTSLIQSINTCVRQLQTHDSHCEGDAPSHANTQNTVEVFFCFHSLITSSDAGYYKTQ